MATVTFEGATFEVSPNPTEGWITIRHTKEDKFLFTLESIGGKVIRQLTLTSGDKKFLAGLAPGLYLLRSQDEAQRVVISR